MAKQEPAVDAPAANGDAPLSWREQAVARSLDSARIRAENRVQRYLDAARELMSEGGSAGDFTVHEVVERSGQSLRSFYQYFGGKHELLLALFEESVRSTTEMLREKVDGENDAYERLHRFVVEYYRLCRPAAGRQPAERQPAPPALVDFAQQLLTGHPNEAAIAFGPLVTLFGELLDAAEAEGSIRTGLRRGPIAGMVLEAIMFNAFSMTIGGTNPKSEPVDDAEELWDLIVHGIGTD